ncbi:MAG: UDP-N-acetylmuramoyl-L-alanine--D-glutamate ligase [Thermanaerothrix sp.]|nr:UDP-N-acetylmuramoyl-L-alanine--D-glutamate ligase [Thermanaerothrix sp.]
MKGLSSHWAGKAVTIIGGGLSGVALARLAKEAGARVFLSDSAKIKEGWLSEVKDMGIAFEEGGHTERLFDADALVLSSGIAPSSPVLSHARDRGIPIIGELDFVAPFLNAPVIAVTGSNGKTTTTGMLGHIFASLGVRGIIAGNIGNPIARVPLDFSDSQVVAAEVSSFQLFWCSRAAFAGSVITNIAPDHIDWHGSFENYVASKRRAMERTMPSGFSVIQRSDVDVLRASDFSHRMLTLAWGDGLEDGSLEDGSIYLDDEAKEAKMILEGGAIRLFRFEQIKLLGKHNLENAAMALASVTMFLRRPVSGDEAGMSTFKSPPHRCEPVGVVNGVVFVDDSKGTNVAATVTALKSLKCPGKGRKIILLGGRGKGETYDLLAKAVLEECSYAVLYGEEGMAIGDALSGAGFSKWTYVADLEDAVKKAYEVAKPDDMVLLSPACTSWDQYSSYKERGDHFKRLVASLV